MYIGLAEARSLQLETLRRESNQTFLDPSPMSRLTVAARSKWVVVKSLNNRCRILLYKDPQGTLILTTTQISAHCFDRVQCKGASTSQDSRWSMGIACPASHRSAPISHEVVKVYLRRFCGHNDVVESLRNS